MADTLFDGDNLSPLDLNGDRGADFFENFDVDNISLEARSKQRYIDELEEFDNDDMDTTPDDVYELDFVQKRLKMESEKLKKEKLKKEQLEKEKLEQDWIDADFSNYLSQYQY
uniref:Uncharacterized protein n=1 Tax=Mimivirus LCMiAC02 TaxID=2506609 RepID=A0A481Z0I3_9VIRU|nr:MAG: hypothetical protein LCMiAC02_00710 [Mimivirus LCMiAC02]